MTASTAARPPLRPYLLSLFVGALVLVAIASLNWDLTALLTAGGREQAWGRLTSFLSAFGAPDLTGSTLEYALSLAGQTLSVALLGTLLGVLLGYPLALGAARCMVLPEAEPGGGARSRRVFLELCRLILDVLRGIPDFAWALLILNFPGPGPVTGILAIGINVGGILGKIYSELWDSVEPDRYQALRSSGAGRLATLLYGIQPLAARSMLSYTLMRTECAIRNASVIGVVGGGGLGAAIFQELDFGNYSTVVTLLLFTLALTASADLLANLFRYQLRTDPNHPRAPVDTSMEASKRRRRIGLFALGAVLLSCAFLLRDGFRDAAAELNLDRQGWDFVRTWFPLIFQPDLSGATLLEAARESVVPLCMGLLATVAGTALAGLIAFPASYALQMESHRFTGEATGRATQLARTFVFLGARALALLFRGIPEVAWVLILASFFRMGMLPGLIGLMLHSAGVLARVFTETVDNIPYRRFEQANYGSRAKVFLYAGLPNCRADWMTYSFFQFEVNVRAGVVLGIIGVGGLGDAFHTSVVNFTNQGALPRASTFLLTMVLLTVLIDRTSRSLKIRCVGC